MKRMTLKNISLMLVIAGVTMLLATKVFADCSNPYPLLSATAGQGKYEIAVVPGANGEFPEKVANGYKYTYKIVRGDLKKLSHMLFFVNYDCKYGLIKTLEYPAGPTNSSTGGAEVCQGDTSTNWGLGFCNGYTLTINPQVDAGIAYAWFIVDKNTTGNMQFALDTGSGTYGGDSGILGPGYEISSAVPIVSNVNISTPDGFYVIAKKNKLSGCIEEFTEDDGVTVIPWQQGKPPWVSEGDDPIDCGDLNNRFCRGCFVNVPGKSLYFWDPILKRYVCYYGCN